ncbi:MAG: hypothetical protein ACFFB3_18585, partial [Candidatus Hodarchaeota archaeon]
RSIEITEESKKSLQDISTGDTLKISLPDQEILEHIPLQTNTWVIIEDGSNIGINGKLVDLEKRIGTNRSIAVLETEDETVVRTSLEYVFVIGKETPMIEIPTIQATSVSETTGEATNDGQE